MTISSPNVQEKPNPAHVSLEAALVQLRLKLLDLTGRNRLLNFKHTAGKSIQFSEGDPAGIYERLVESANRPSVSILGLPEPPRREWIERNGRLSRPDPREWALRNGISTSYDLASDRDSAGSNVRALLYSDDLAKHCRKLEREATLAIEETGSNMLFIVLGFLEYPDQRESDRIFQAPLVSIPVIMSRKEINGHQVFFIQYTGEDISENISLREKFKNDFAITIPALHDENRSTEEEIDLEAYFGDVQKIIKDQPRFALKRRISLALLSFTNMLLVRDLDPKRWPEVAGKHELLDHPIVRQVFEGQDDEGDYGYGTAPEHAVEEGNGAKVQLIYDADSSQHSALVDVIFEKKNIVIEGPPGTGKSQTITNLIAASIADGKKVLFIAEKLAALDVVRSRISAAGLSLFALELHSNKTNKKKLFEVLGQRIQYRSENVGNLPFKLQQLGEARRQLKQYADLANSVIGNRLSLTLHELIWTAERHRAKFTASEPAISQIGVTGAGDLSRIELARRVEALEHLGAQYQVVGGFNQNSPFWGFEPDSIVPGDEDRIATLLSDSIDWMKAFSSEAATYSRLVGGLVEGATKNNAAAQNEILARLEQTADEPIPLELLPAFIANDGSGAGAKRMLDDLAGQIAQFQALGPVAARGLKVDVELTDDRLEALKQVGRSAATISVALGTPSEVAAQHAVLMRELPRLKEAADTVQRFCDEKGITFDGTRARLEHLCEVARLASNAPEDALHVQGPGLLRVGCVQALRKLEVLQSKWVDLRTSLADELYIDNIVDNSTLAQAILTLREGDAWYRPLQGRWRKAILVHKRQQKTKNKLSATARLRQLEQLQLLQSTRQDLDNDDTWRTFVGVNPPRESFPLGDHIELAEWNAAMSAAVDELGNSTFRIDVENPEQVRALRRQFAALRLAGGQADSSLALIQGVIGRLEYVPGGATLDGVRKIADAFAAMVGMQLGWLESNCPAQTTFADCLAGCTATIERNSIQAATEANAELKNLLGDKWRGVDTDVAALKKVLAFGDAVQGCKLAPQIKRHIRSNDPRQAIKDVRASLGRLTDGFEKLSGFAGAMTSFGEFDLETWAGVAFERDLVKFTQELLGKCERAAGRADALVPWAVYVARRNETGSLGLSVFRARLEAGSVAPGEIGDLYAYSVHATIVREIFREVPELGKFSGLKHSQIRSEFQRLDKETINLRGKAIAAVAASRAQPPQGRNGTRVDEKTEMYLLNLLLPQQRPRMPVRKMFERAAGSIQALKPCFMMSPQAVAQFLPPGRVKFDVVIMDEASQLKPEQAIGAVARGGQLVVVGDPKQLPPTSFFTRGGQNADDEEEYTTTDAESILDVCAGHFRPTRALKWHYRSQHHSLIAFSNANFYKNLIIFPSPYGQSSELGVRATYLADAVYDNQTNLKEAKRVVDAVVDHILKRPKESLGVVTLNIKQRDLISELIEERFSKIKGADDYRREWREKQQPFFVRNLENVQGDERDAIIISTTFGKPPGAGAVRQNFGPISRQGGWRRLNVLFTRAKRSVAVFTSMRPDDIVVDRSTPEGTKALRAYLEYARSGHLITAQETGAEPDSDFEVAVMDVLRARGFKVTPQLGVAGYRIDIAVKHPDAPGVYLAAIECDGASYHSALSVRDRDRIRQEILESMGWRGRIWRIWSTDWFRAPRQETEKLLIPAAHRGDSVGIPSKAEA